MTDPQRFLECRARLMEQLEMSRDMPDEEILALIDELIAQTDPARRMRYADRSHLRTQLFNSVRRLDILQELIDDDSVTEIMVNGTDSIYVERSGRLAKWEKHFTSREKLQDIVQAIVAVSNRVANESVPIVDARLKKGERVNIVMNPVAIEGPVITIRRFPDRPIRMEDLIAWGSITAQAAEFLKKMVQAGYNIFISGGTGSGKTTFLNALSNFIPEDERIITIEDNAELQIRGDRNLVRLEARRPNAEGEGEVTIRDLIRSSLRMRPDRIIVGEVRGEETIDMLQSLNTGHDGSLSTGHGNSPRDMLSRLETMVIMGMEIPIAAIRRQIASGIDLMVHLSRMRDKSRKVLEILEIDGYDVQTGEIRTHTIYEYQGLGEEKDGKLTGSLKKTGELRHTQKLERAGIALNQ
ncbi:MAG: CpaF family protein [Lachnospiraceae bacterium]|nr:CpaF family protein [Lachnospiraceae bacterium]